MGFGKSANNFFNFIFIHAISYTLLAGFLMLQNQVFFFEKFKIFLKLLTFNEKVILYCLKFNFTENGPKMHLCITHSYLHNISSGFSAIFKTLALRAILSMGGSGQKIKKSDFF